MIEQGDRVSSRLALTRGAPTSLHHLLADVKPLSVSTVLLPSLTTSAVTTEALNAGMISEVTMALLPPLVDLAMNLPRLSAGT